MCSLTRINGGLVVLSALIVAGVALEVNQAIAGVHFYLKYDDIFVLMPGDVPQILYNCIVHIAERQPIDSHFIFHK